MQKTPMLDKYELTHSLERSTARDRLKLWNDEAFVFLSPYTKNVSQFPENEQGFFFPNNASIILLVFYMWNQHFHNQS